MAKEPTKNGKDMWLKVLIGFIITVMVLSIGVGGKAMEKKVNKEVFEQHEVYQAVQYKEIKDSLTRIEEKL